jgi:hypothetical protein
LRIQAPGWANATRHSRRIGRSRRVSEPPARTMLCVLSLLALAGEDHPPDPQDRQQNPRQ